MINVYNHRPLQYNDAASLYHITESVAASWIMRKMIPKARDDVPKCLLLYWPTVHSSKIFLVYYQTRLKETENIHNKEVGIKELGFCSLKKTQSNKSVFEIPHN